MRHPTPPSISTPPYVLELSLMFSTALLALLPAPALRPRWNAIAILKPVSVPFLIVMLRRLIAEMPFAVVPIPAPSPLMV